MAKGGKGGLGPFLAGFAGGYATTTALRAGAEHMRRLREQEDSRGFSGIINHGDDGFHKNRDDMERG